MSDIDKDIEIVKDLISFNIECAKNCEGKTLKDIYIARSKAIENVLSELETYKKIAKKLAEEIYIYDAHNEYGKYCQFKNTLCNTQDDECTQCIIDWARNEVENEENNSNN